MKTIINLATYVLWLNSLIATINGQGVFEKALSFSQSNADSVERMMSQIRRDGDDGKTWVMAYGDSITDGFGASDMLKLGYTNLLKEGLKIIHPTFDLVRNSAGFRCVNRECERPCFKDAYC